MKISVNPHLTGYDGLTRLASFSYDWPVEPDDNEGAYYYEDNVYSFASSLQKVALAVGILGMFVFLGGLFKGKMIGV